MIEECCNLIRQHIGLKNKTLNIKLRRKHFCFRINKFIFSFELFLVWPHGLYHRPSKGSTDKSRQIWATSDANFPWWLPPLETLWYWSWSSVMLVIGFGSQIPVTTVQFKLQTSSMKEQLLNPMTNGLSHCELDNCSCKNSHFKPSSDHWNCYLNL